MNIQTILRQATVLMKKSGNFLQVNSPTIFAGIAIAGVVGTTIMAVRAQMKADEIIEEACYVDPDTEEYIEPTIRECIALTWKQYIPVALMAGLTIGAVVTSHTVQARRNAILAGLLTTSQHALEEYQAKTEEIVGKNKAKAIKEGVADDILAKHPIERSTIITTGFGNSLCYDTWSGRYFWSDYEKIRQIVNDFNFQLNNDFAMCLNEFYELLNLDTAGCGEEVGFTTVRPLELEYKSRLASDGTPCLVIDYKYQPSPSFRTC